MKKYFQNSGSCKNIGLTQAGLLILSMIKLSIILSACAGQRLLLTQPVPGYFDTVSHDVSLMLDDITETRDGPGNLNLPDWLIAFFIGGIEEVERMDFYLNRYCFIGTNEGSNFGALNKWAANYSVVQDFTRLAALRIEKRLASAAVFPDDEYGAFYERLVKKAFDTEYPDALIENTYWIKTTVNQDFNAEDVYEFFVFISIDKILMQTVIRRMMTEVRAGVTPSRAQNNAINRLQQTFFEGF